MPLAGWLSAIVATLLIVSGVAHGIYVVSDNGPLLTEEFAHMINRKAKGQWVASHDNGRIMRNITHSRAKGLMGVQESLFTRPLTHRVFTPAEEAIQLPESFDATEQWPQCETIGEIRDQSGCGSCWAIAAVGAMSDRYCVAANITNLRISTANLLTCCFTCGFGCNGGIPIAAWYWWVWVGLTAEECQPYPFAPCGHHGGENHPPCPSSVYPTPKCNSSCIESDIPMQRYKGASAYGVSGEDAFKRELYTNGPFEIAFTVFEDFLLYKRGVYSHHAGSQLGGHAVRLIGWGEENGVPYWKVANSWNSDWGDKGYFRILRGTNECNIEGGGVAGLPKAPGK